MTKQEEIEYWSKRLLSIHERSDALQKEWHMNHKLDIVDQYETMGLLLDVRSYSTLLAEALAKPDDPKPSFIRRILRK